MENFKKFNLDSAEEDILKEIQLLEQVLNTPTRQALYSNYLTKLLELKQQRKILNEQSESNKKNLVINRGLLEENKKTSRNSRWTAVAAFFAALVSIGGLWLSNYQFNKINRPFLVFDLTRTQISAINENANSVKIEAFLTNTGNVPAKFELSNIASGGYEGVAWEAQDLYGYDNFSDGVIFPNQQIKLMWFARWDNTSNNYQEWIKSGEGARLLFFPISDISVPIKYSRLDDNDYKYETIMDGFPARTDDGLLGKSQFIWKITDAN